MTSKTILTLTIGAFIGSFAMAAIADYQIKVQALTVDCVEHIMIDNNAECSIFEWRGETYATEFAPITMELN